MSTYLILFSYKFYKIKCYFILLEEVVAYGKGSTECFPLLHRLTYSVLPKL